MLRRTRPVLACCAAALLASASAAPARADHDGWREARPYPVHRHGASCEAAWNRGHQRVAAGHGHAYGGESERWHAPRHGHHWAPRGGQPGHHGLPGHGRFGCGPCGRRWDSRSSFYHHLSHYHDVAPHWAPYVLVDVEWGWLFSG